jgi:hypothetical protein
MFFLHADSLPTPLFYNLITTSISKGFNCGSFRTQFDSSSFYCKMPFLLGLITFSFEVDQGIFVTKALWDEIGATKRKCLSWKTMIILLDCGNKDLTLT